MDIFLVPQMLARPKFAPVHSRQSDLIHQLQTVVLVQNVKLLQFPHCELTLLNVTAVNMIGKILYIITYNVHWLNRGNARVGTDRL
jgi:hypothetical protein